jgi:hypothetical protein
VPLKTDGSRRKIEMAPALAKLLPEHYMASYFKAEEDFVFTTSWAALTPSGT